MLRQTQHRHPIANGYSGYTLPHQLVFEAGLRELDETILEALQRLGPVAVVVVSERADAAPSMALLDRFRDARQTARLPTGAIYQLAERRDPIERSQDRLLPIEAIVTSGPRVDPAPA